MKAERLEALICDHCVFLRYGKGSHRIYKNRSGKQFTFGYHRGDTVAPHMVKRILLRDVELTQEEAEQVVGI